MCLIRLSAYAHRLSRTEVNPDFGAIGGTRGNRFLSHSNTLSHGNLSYLVPIQEDGHFLSCRNSESRLPPRTKAMSLMFSRAALYLHRRGHCDEIARLSSVCL